MQVQMENVLPSSPSIRKNEVHTIAAGYCPQFTCNPLRRLEDLCACLIIQVFKTGDVLQRNDQWMAFERQEGNDTLGTKKNMRWGLARDY